MLSPETIMKGVIDGVEAGGNQSGIPTPQGFVTFDDRFVGKPLVFVGTIGLIPREINGKPGHEKCANPGDKIVVAGGRVGRDGIHGATFSSVALDEGSPATAVQIGDPITQKKCPTLLSKKSVIWGSTARLPITAQAACLLPSVKWLKAPAASMLNWIKYR